MNKIFQSILTLSFLLFLAGCSPTDVTLVGTRPPEVSIDNKIKTLIIHEDLIRSEKDDLGIKRTFLKFLSQKLEESPRFNVIYYSSGQEVKVSEEKAIGIFSGKIWSYDFETRGKISRVVNKSEKKTNNLGEMTEIINIDEVKNLRWVNQESLVQANLNLIEISEKPRNLTHTIPQQSFRELTSSDAGWSFRSLKTFLGEFVGEELWRVFSSKENGIPQRNKMIEELVQHYLVQLIPTQTKIIVSLVGADSEMEDWFLSGQYEKARVEIQTQLEVNLEAGNQKKAELNYLLGVTWEASAASYDDYFQAGVLYKKALDLNSNINAYYQGLGRIEKTLQKLRG